MTNISAIKENGCTFSTQVHETDMVSALIVLRQAIASAMRKHDSHIVLARIVLPTGESHNYIVDATGYHAEIPCV